MGVVLRISFLAFDHVYLQWIYRQLSVQPRRSYPVWLFKIAIGKVLDPNPYVHLHFACSSTLTLLNIARVALFVCSLTISQQFDTENNTSMKTIPRYAVDLFTPPTLPYLSHSLFKAHSVYRRLTVQRFAFTIRHPRRWRCKFVNFGTFPTLPFTRC